MPWLNFVKSFIPQVKWIQLQLSVRGDPRIQVGRGRIPQLAGWDRRPWFTVGPFYDLNLRWRPCVTGWLANPPAACCAVATASVPPASQHSWTHIIMQAQAQCVLSNVQCYRYINSNSYCFIYAKCPWCILMHFFPTKENKAKQIHTLIQDAYIHSYIHS